MNRQHRKMIIKCFLIVTFACLLFSNIAVLHGENTSTPAPSDQSNVPHPDATGQNTGTAKDVPAATPGQPSVVELANSVGHSIIAINIVWTLVAGFLVFFMQAGFAFLETGFTRAKNVAHTMGMNIFIYGLGVFGWYVCGFALMYGGLGPLTTLGGFAGLNHEVAITILGHSFGLFGGQGFFLTGTYDVGVFTLFLFEVVFMDTAATIPTGAMAERWKWASFVIYGLLVGSIIYPLFGNWVWGGGWLSQLGVNFGLGHGHVDFAGSSVVHMTGGMIGLVGAWMLGPRIGKYNKDGTVNAIPGHNIPMAVLGTLILAFGWFGFNPGSTLAGTDLRIGVIATNTMLASVLGMLAATFWMWGVRSDKPDPTMMCNGLVAGLVAITAPCAFVNSQGACIIGLVAGILVVESVLFIDKKLKIDDPVGAISAHAVSGAWGCLGLGLFADGTYGAGWNGVSGTVTGLLYGNPGQFAAQCIGVLTNFIYVGAIAFVIFKLIDIFVGNRVDAETEIDGLDIGQMGVSGYERLSADERGFP
ncbi:MAG TPA: ammonium transporter [Candidatus Acidoferrum sp.]|nr:ammonium transporter [Candidatus Acidoferrum sp.]